MRLALVLRKYMNSGVYMFCTLDLWTDTVEKVSYMYITTHYIDEDFELHDRSLHVNSIRGASYTAIMVLDEFTEGL